MIDEVAGGMDLYILDIEASGLDDESYPIEIAWCSIDGDDSFSTLVNPESAGGWEHWDHYAEEAIHGISREECCLDGENVVVTAQRAKALLLDHQVFTDAAYQDQFWLDRLFEAAGVSCADRILQLDQAVPPTQRFNLAKSLAEMHRPHRALSDCLLLRDLVRKLRATAN
ncbi:hypothetical protein SAMN04487881_0046 [Marinobacter sp. es.048]|uniref:3'-5' exonuclease n=1 Tax=Marinobacter sp. es.048 TaxID=1761795 RepID=UPI000B5945EA|nr:hypothetical protein [Marinobacter sp. es.048]SNC59386.1 hypothetical protein SAMN04487881_0046 [Marinobacter sp. es.048]